jgi:DNA-binding MarR family transcriptional regulator
MPAPTRPPQLSTRLRLVVTRLARRLRQEAGAGVSPTQQAVLATIGREGPVTPGDLARLERVQPPTVTAAVKRLEEGGLVRRRPDLDDGRAIRLETTAAGTRLLEEFRSRKRAYLDRRLQSLTPEERATLAAATAILERLLAAAPEEAR